MASVLVSGASGLVGERLLPLLEALSLIHI